LPDSPPERAAILAALRTAQAERANRSSTLLSDDYIDGAIAALTWALGEADSPMTDRVGDRPPSTSELRQEAAIAYEVITGQRHDMDREFAAGAENTLVWLYSGHPRMTPFSA
jgi:hypothetical protein